MSRFSDKQSRSHTNRGKHRDARDLQRAVSNLVRIYQFRDRKSICYYNISVTQCYALSNVIERGPLSQNELAADLYLDKSTASRVIAELTRKGYVRRVPDPNDGRVRNLEVTGKGRDLYGRIEQDLVEEMQELIAGHNPATRRATIELITQLTDAAIGRFGRIGRACGDKG